MLWWKHSEVNLEITEVDKENSCPLTPQVKILYKSHLKKKKVKSFTLNSSFWPLPEGASDIMFLTAASWES